MVLTTSARLAGAGARALTTLRIKPEHLPKTSPLVQSQSKMDGTYNCSYV